MQGQVTYNHVDLRATQLLSVSARKVQNPQPEICLVYRGTTTLVTVIATTGKHLTALLDGINDLTNPPGGTAGQPRRVPATPS